MESAVSCLVRFVSSSSFGPAAKQQFMIYSRQQESILSDQKDFQDPYKGHPGVITLPYIGAREKRKASTDGNWIFSNFLDHKMIIENSAILPLYFSSGFCILPKYQSARLKNIRFPEQISRSYLDRIFGR